MKKNGLLTLLAIGSLSVGLTSCDDDSKINIGILQYATHDALTLCKEGFVEVLEKNGFKDKDNITLNIQNPEGNTSTMQSMSRNMVGTADLIFAIATPAALAVKTSLEDYSKSTPLLFSAVTDPIESNLVTSFTDHGNVTGTSDAGPTADNIALFKEFNITKIGILWNTAESNSQIQKDETVEACNDLGIELVDGGITSATQISSKLSSFIAQGVKGIFIPTDNMVAGAISNIKEEAIENKLVVVCADSSVTQNGGSLGYSVDYKILGETTAKMALKILKNEAKVEDIPVSYSESFPLEINEDFFTQSGIEIPDSIKEIANI